MGLMPGSRLWVIPSFSFFLCGKRPLSHGPLLAEDSCSSFVGIPLFKASFITENLAIFAKYFARTGCTLTSGKVSFFVRARLEVHDSAERVRDGRVSVAMGSLKKEEK